MADRKLILTNVNGSLTVKNDLIADSLSLNYRDQRFTLNAVLKNFVPWVSGRPEILDISGNLHTDRLVTSMFIAEKRDTAATEDKPSDLFPADVTASVAIRADSLIFNNFRAAGFSSRLIYKPYVITFGEAKAEGLDGSLTGEFMLSEQKDGGYITRTNLNVRGIDINKAFTAFNVLS